MSYQLVSSITTKKDKPVRSPNENDVLCGRGSGPYSHPGNQQFREIVVQHKTMYNAVGNGNDLKTLIAEEVVRFIYKQNPPGRFLSKSCGIWYEVPRSVAVQKTKQALREKRKWSKCDSFLETKPLPNISTRSTKSRSSLRRRRHQHDDVPKSSTSQQVLHSNSLKMHGSDDNQRETIAIVPSDIQDSSHSMITNFEITSSQVGDKVSRKSICDIALTDELSDMDSKTFQIDEIDMLIIQTFKEVVIEDEDSDSSIPQKKTENQHKKESFSKLDKSVNDTSCDSSADHNIVSELPNISDSRKYQLWARSA